MTVSGQTHQNHYTRHCSNCYGKGCL